MHCGISRGVLKRQYFPQEAIRWLVAPGESFRALTPARFPARPERSPFWASGVRPGACVDVWAGRGSPRVPARAA